MRKFILILFLFCTSARLMAQDDTLQALLQEGVALHDKGDYDGALKIYDEVLAKDPNRLLAWYEKSLTLFVAQRYQECADLCKDVLKKFREGDELENIYVNYGSALDALGKPDEAIKVYSQGIRKYNHYLLFFNRGITEFQNKKTGDAINDFEQTLLLNPLHASSHQYLGYTVYGENKVACLMALSTFLIIESNSNRSEKNLKILQELFGSFAKKTGEKTISITLNSSALDSKKSKPDNFSITEMTLALDAALDHSDSVKQFVTPADRLKKKLELFAGVDPEGKKGFFTEFYIPFFRAMKEAGYLETAANMILARSNDDQVKNWISSNEAKLNSFAQWLQEYRWSSKAGNN
ncbi:MAG: tetratricopeptide repeat protein [Chitinophagaceae bacterium]|nr:tetratricopeptide repeat protein [Chitinophagaceae bacterium]